MAKRPSTGQLLAEAVLLEELGVDDEDVDAEEDEAAEEVDVDEEDDDEDEPALSPEPRESVR